MTHIVAATVQLGPAYTGLAIGYRTVRLDKTTVVTAFTTTSVDELPAGTGRFQVDNGVVAHDEGGYIVWGEAGTDVLWGSLPPSPLTAQNVWEYGTRTLTSFGTLMADIWSNVTRTLTGDASIDQADVVAALTTYDAATGADVAGLNDLSQAEVETAVTTALTSYDVATVADIAAISCGDGTFEFTYTLTSSATNQPIPNATIRITSDLAGTNTIWTGTTDALGIARNACGDKPRLAAGTIYVWRTHANFTFNDPDTESVS